MFGLSVQKNMFSKDLFLMPLMFFALRSISMFLSLLYLYFTSKPFVL